jgi:hypothetical protein
MSEPEDVRTEQPELPRHAPHSPIAEAIDRLEKRWGVDGHPYPYCANTVWTVSFPFQFSVVYTDEAPQQVSQTGVFFAVACTNCGQTVFINRSAAEA